MAFNIFALPASSIMLLLSAAFRFSNALPWPGPEPTKLYKEDAWSPRPTNIPGDPLELFKRASVDVTVCGWIGGDSSNPAVCPTGSSCIHDTAHWYVGCCTTSGSCTAGVYTSCVDKNSPGGKSGPEVINNGVFTCPGDQECYRNTYPGNYFQWGCGSSDQATTVETSFSGQPSDLLLQVVFTGVTFKPMTLSSTSESTTTSKDSSTPSTTSDSNPSRASKVTSSTTAAVGNSKSKQKSNVGAIAGGTIGGLALLIAILGIILFFYRRRQNSRKHQRAGSFISTIRKNSRGAGSTPGTAPRPFHRLQPYSPDDFVSPMVQGVNTKPTPPMNPSAFQPSDQAVSSPTEYQGIEERMRENAAMPNPEVNHYPASSSGNEGQPLVSEIDHFSHSFNAAIAQIPPPPPTPHQTQFLSQSRDPESSHVELPPLRDPNSRNQYSSGASGIGGAAQDANYNAAEDKETAVESSHTPIIRKTVPGFRNENARVEGWQPASMKPAKTPSPERSTDYTPRYQLVDQPPTENMPVLHTPGQLRWSGKHQRDKPSF